MLKVFFLYLTESDNSNWKFYLEKLPVTIQHEILRIKIPSVQIQKTYAKILLRQTLISLGYPGTILNEIVIGENGKPVIPSFSGDFNISHAENLIALIISDKPGVGIDIEKKRPIDPTGFKIYFSREEWQQIMHARAEENTLLRLWTIKEALLKARSTGFSNSLEDLHINYSANMACFMPDNNLFYWNYIDTCSDYIICYATCQKVVIPEITVVNQRLFTYTFPSFITK